MPAAGHVLSHVSVCQMVTAGHGNAIVPVAGFSGIGDFATQRSLTNDGE